MKTHAKKKTILHLIETGGPGGAEKVLVSLACNLDTEEFRSVVCLRRHGWLNDELIRCGIKTYVVKEKGCFDLGFILNLLVLIGREKVALIHAHEFLMNVYGAILGSLSGRRVVTTVHGKYYYWEKRRRKVSMQFASRRSQMVCVSNELREFVKAKVGIKENNVRTIHNGIDLNGFWRNSSEAIRKAELDMGDTAKVVGTVGNLYAVKGQIYLIKAIPMILKECPNVVFLFVGRGEEGKKLRQEAINLGIADWVRFLGFRADVRELLTLMDVFVLPSLSESLPIALLEAMALSVPPVVTDVGGNSEIIENNKSGFLVRARDPGALADKIVLLLKDNELASRMGLEACEAVKNKFSLERMVRDYEALYRCLL